MSIIKPEYLTFDDLLQKRFFEIPDYQRTYSWTKKQRQDLFNDIKKITTWRDKERHHFMSTIVCLRQPKKNQQVGTTKFEKFDVVDGQQRLTTLIILLKAISKRLKKSSDEEKKEIEVIEELLVKKKDRRLILLQTNHDNLNIFRNYLEKGTKPPTREEAEEIAEDVFHLKHVFPSRDPEREGPYERARNASKLLVGNYAEGYPEDFVQSRSLEQRFELKADKALITGSIDLLLREDNDGNILEARVIDFKSMDFPEGQLNPFFWINLSLQVQLYAYAADIVLGENAKTGSVHLLKAPNTEEVPNRVNVPITDEAIESAIQNIEWAVNRILDGEFPMRPSNGKCEECDFRKICSKQKQEFNSTEVPSPIHIPETNGTTRIGVRSFSDVE